MTLRQEKMPGGWAIDLFRDGRSISRLWIADRQMRVGSQPVKIGGIAGVGTDPALRNKGLASRVMEAALELMKREGYDASFLYGIRLLPSLWVYNLHASAQPRNRNAPRRMRTKNA